MTNVGLLPYDFEPEHGSDSEVSLSSDSEDSMDILDDSDRIHSTNWCQCDNCVALPTVAECLCCCELRELISKLNSQNIECITEHTDFGIVCLHPEVLRTALLARADIRQDEMENPTANEKLRHQAYRQFTYWVHKKLGRYVRRVIPACVVKTIRDQYPSTDGHYVGFMEAE